LRDMTPREQADARVIQLVACWCPQTRARPQGLAGWLSFIREVRCESRQHWGSAVVIRPTALERAFELARSGQVSELRGIIKSLKREGYTTEQVQGPALTRQLNLLARSPCTNERNGQREGTTMEWVIKSRDLGNGREGIARYSTEASFLVSLQDLLHPTSKIEFVSATLPTGKVLEEMAARVMIGQPG